MGNLGLVSTPLEQSYCEERRPILPQIPSPAPLSVKTQNEAQMRTKWSNKHSVNRGCQLDPHFTVDFDPPPTLVGLWTRFGDRFVGYLRVVCAQFVTLPKVRLAVRSSPRTKTEAQRNQIANWQILPSRHRKQLEWIRIRIAAEVFLTATLLVT